MPTRRLLLPLSVMLIACSGDTQATRDSDTALTPDTVADTASQDDANIPDSRDSTQTDSFNSDTTSPDTTAPDTTGPDTTDPDAWPWPLGEVSVPADPSWRRRITFFTDPFQVAPLDAGQRNPHWIKFTVLTADPTFPLFHDGRLFPFHFDFAHAKLPLFADATPSSFDTLTLYNLNKKAILGAVLFAPIAGPAPVAREVGIQLVGADPYPTAVALRVLTLIRDHLDTDDGPPPALFYMPTFEQRAAAIADRARFEAAGFPISSPDRWLDGDACLANGWALGRLVHLAATDVPAAWHDGRLTRHDILLIDEVPAELPPVAGILSLAPTSAASHVAILSQTYKTPLAYAATAATRAAALAAADTRTLLTVGPTPTLSHACRVTLTPESAFPPADAAALLAQKTPAPIAYPPKIHINSSTRDAALLSPSDANAFGGKAANFGILRRTIPNNSPTPALAISFDVFDRFLDGPAPGSPGQSLRAAIAARLAPFQASAAPDLAALSTALDAVRTLVKDATFTSSDETTVLTALSDFDPVRKIRVRSSTNVEDGATFSGAGLYDSYSGCLADDLDDDTTGPSHCDPAEPKERGIFRALRKVYASFWNDNAYLARLTHGVDEAEVAMGALLHYSFPDEIERANGVALSTQSGSNRQHLLTTQAGATSVTNPDTSAQPEVVRVENYTFGSYPTLVQSSALVPLGANVLTWDSDYLALAGLFDAVLAAWPRGGDRAQPFTLDFEYKKMATPSGDALIVKQVRPAPMTSTRPEDAYLVPSAPQRLCTFQGEYGSLFGNHRNKFIFELTPRPAFIGQPATLPALYTHLSVTGPGFSLSGAPATLPGAFSTPPNPNDSSPARIDGFALGSGATARTLALASALPWQVRPPSPPFVVLADGYLTLTTTWQVAQPDPDHWEGPTTTTDAIRLGLCPEAFVASPENPSVTRSVTAEAVSVTSKFYYWPPPSGPVAGYTASLAAWDQTTITGLTSSPITLRGFWSQTFRPAHHNFEESFYFEPRLEADLDPQLLDELEAADVVAILMTTSYDGGSLRLIGRDGKIRNLCTDCVRE